MRTKIVYLGGMSRQYKNKTDYELRKKPRVFLEERVADNSRPIPDTGAVVVPHPVPWSLRASWRERDQSMPFAFAQPVDGIANELCDAVELQFLHDIGAMCFHRFDTEMQR